MTFSLAPARETLVHKHPAAHAPAKIHIGHIQLRDLIVCPAEAGKVAYVTSEGLSTRDVRNPQEDAQRIKGVGFTPDCIASGSGLIAAGGQHGEIFLSSLPSSEDSWSYSSHIRGDINNSMFITNLTVAPSPYAATSFEPSYFYSERVPVVEEPRLFVSNNDKSLKAFNIATRLEAHDGEKGRKKRLCPAGQITLGTCVNHASMSPDGRTLLVVGDTTDAFLYDVRGGTNVTFGHIATYQAGTDAGFSTAWSADGLKFAVASQDGCVTVWDVRSSNPTAKLFSQAAKKPPPSSVPTPSVEQSYVGPDGGRYWAPAAPRPFVHYSVEVAEGISAKGVRSMKFSPMTGGLDSGTRDLLIFTEHTNHVHVVDARTFNSHSIMRVPRLSDLSPQPTAKPTMRKNSRSEDRKHTPSLADSHPLSNHPITPVSPISRSTTTYLPGEGNSFYCTPAPTTPSSPNLLSSNAFGLDDDSLSELDFELDIDAMREERNREERGTALVDFHAFRREHSHSSPTPPNPPPYSPSHYPQITVPPSTSTTRTVDTVANSISGNHNLTGVCFDPTGRYMYVGTEESVIEYDVSYDHGGYIGGHTRPSWESSAWA